MRLQNNRIKTMFAGLPAQSGRIFGDRHDTIRTFMSIEFRQIGIGRQQQDMTDISQRHLADSRHFLGGGPYTYQSCQNLSSTLKENATWEKTAEPNQRVPRSCVLAKHQLPFLCVHLNRLSLLNSPVEEFQSERI
jgi:hypothetical protein